MIRELQEFPQSLYIPWCKLYKWLAVDYQSHLVNLLQDDNARVLQHAFYKADQTLEDMAFELSQCRDSPSDVQLRNGYACLKALENRYKLDPWRHKRDKIPEVKIENQRYILLFSRTGGYIAAAIPKKSRFTLDEQIGRNRILNLPYRWIAIPAETTFDTGYTRVLDALVVKSSVRVGIAPFANNRDMHWHADCTDQRGVNGEVPMRCIMATDDKALWQCLADVLERAYQNQVQILLFPELVLSQTLLEKTMTWLASHNIDNRVIQLVVAGTRHVDSDKSGRRFRNRCTVLDGSGAVDWIQDKRQPFTLDTDQVRTFLPQFNASAAFEPTELSQALTVRETAIGRILTPICLDYIHEDIWRELAGDLYLVPAMSSGLSRFEDRSRALGQGGAASLVCNARVDGAQEDRVVAYLPSKHRPNVTKCGDNLFTLDIALLMN